MDEDLRELERAARADGAAALRFARALVRSGDEARAATELARLVDERPDDREALVLLDAITRGGVDPASPWPGEQGDGRHSSRSRVAGPTRGALVGRRLVLEKVTPKSFAVDRDGCAVTLSANVTVVRIDPATGDVAPLVTGMSGRSLSSPRLCPGHLLCELDLQTGIFAAGPGRLATTRGNQGIEVRGLAPAGPSYWTAAIPRPGGAFAFAPGAQLVVLTAGGLGARGSLLRFDLASGKPLSNRSLERVGGSYSIVVGEEGRTYLRLGPTVAALDVDGSPLWQLERPANPVALAGEAANVLVVSEPKSLAPIALDVSSGELLWESRDACLIGPPKVDARGVIYWRREQELVALDPLTGETIYQALVGDRFWDFAFDGRGHALVLRNASTGVSEIAVFE